MDMDRLAERALDANRKLQADREATQLDATKKAVDDFRDEIDRKLVAYTSVADMTPEDFRRMIEGNWKKTRTSDDISHPDPDDISLRVQRWARKESDMFADDISQPTGDISHPPIPTQLREIGKSLFRIARAWWKGIP